MTHHPFAIGETANAALDNISGHLEVFLAAIRDDLDALRTIEGYTARDSERWFRLEVDEHLADVYPESLAAARQHFDRPSAIVKDPQCPT